MRPNLTRLQSALTLCPARNQSRQGCGMLNPAAPADHPCHRFHGRQHSSLRVSSILVNVQEFGFVTIFLKAGKAG